MTVGGLNRAVQVEQEFCKWDQNMKKFFRERSSLFQCTVNCGCKWSNYPLQYFWHACLTNLPNSSTCTFDLDSKHFIWFSSPKTYLRLSFYSCTICYWIDSECIYMYTFRYCGNITLFNISMFTNKDTDNDYSYIIDYDQKSIWLILCRPLLPLIPCL